jgi:hypothetical protein
MKELLQAVQMNTNSYYTLINLLVVEYVHSDSPL